MADAFQEFAQQYATYGYPVLFVGVLLENMGIPVPGETAVLVAGFLCSPPGGEHFHLGWVIALTIVAAVLGDNLGFWLGHRWARPRLLAGRRFLFLTPKTLELAEGYFARYGLWTIFFARFITGLRVVGALAAGTAGMPWRRFLVANASGAVAWAVTMSLLGYFFGQSWELLHYYLGRGGVLILGSVVLIVGLPYLLRRLRKMSFRPLERVTRAQIVQGVLAAGLEVVCVALLVALARERHVTAVDRRIADWVSAHPAAWCDFLADVGNTLATLPAVTLWTALLLAQLWYRGRPGRESVAALWALVASESVGLLLVGLLHLSAVQPTYTDLWPYGFAGLVPMRAFAVFGMIAQLLVRQHRSWGRIAQGSAAVLVGLAGFGMVWTGTQLFTEVVLDYAAGGVVLFTGMWWLEGYGPGFVEVPPHPGGMTPELETLRASQSNEPQMNTAEHR